MLQWSDQDWIFPSSAASSTDEINSIGIGQQSNSSSSATSVPERCVICEKTDAPFSRIPPWDDLTTLPALCVTCVDQSLRIANESEIGVHDTSTGSPIRGTDLDNQPCLVCQRQLSASEFPEKYIVESCQHQPNICLDCIENSIIECLDNDLLQMISCPQCGEVMSADEVWRFSRANTYERYEKAIQLAKVQECVVCAENLPGAQFPQEKVTSTCTHTPSTCLECIAHHIKSQLETRMWDQIDCPECSALLEYADVAKFASKTIFQMYDSLMMRDAVSSDPNFRWCTACSSGQVHSDGAESPLIICTSCRAMSCFTHQSPWHEGITCVDFDNLKSPEEKGKGSSLLGSRRFLSSLTDMCDWNHKINISGVHRKETDQEKKDRKLAMRMVKEQEEEEKKRLRRIEQNTRKVAQAKEAERQEKARRVREAQEKAERERQAKETQKIRARQQKEESATDALLQKITQPCPGKCGWRIEKKDGCDHMTC